MSTPAVDLAQAITEYLEEGWSCPPDATRMLTEAARLLGEERACGASDSAVLDRIRHVLHDNNLGCTGTPGKHHVVAEQILAAVREVS
jgi:hypothetical protein